MELLIDYGGTHFRYSCCGHYEKLLSKDINLVEFIEDMIKKYNVRRIGVAFAGQVNDGKILYSPNIKGLDGFDLKRYFQERFAIDVLLENDLNCAALYEKNYFKSNHIAVIYIGTGVGAAFVDERLIRGVGNLAGELGHIPYKETPFVCGCGKNNCLELTCSGKAMKLRGFDDLSDPEFSREFFDCLNFAIEVVTILLNPEIVVLGGGVVEHNKLIINPYLPKFTHVRVELSKAKDAVLKGLKLLLRSEEK